MRARGFTLVEMLVTLVLVALVAGLLWQALATVARLEATLARTRTLGDDDALRRAWVELALGGVMTGTAADPVRFSGRDDGLTAYSTMPPWPGSLGPEAMTLAIERGGVGGVGGGSGERLLARRGSDGEPVELWRWPDPGGRFDYLDADGRWHGRWPPPLDQASPGQPTRPPPLPAAVRLSGPPAGPLLVPITAGRNPMLQQQELLPDDAVLRR
jgi:prepilin-type N-terminal cleavage/methylation domain-containing protein